MKQKSSLDIAKFICALLILVLHTAPLSSYSKLLTFGLRNILCVIAVPFFFCTSGYLLTEKLNSLKSSQEQAGYIKKYLKRLAVIYLFWSAVYFPFVVINWVRGDFSAISVLKYVRDFFFEGSYSTIWFLPALMSAVLFYWLLRKKLSNKKIFYVGCGIYIATLLLSSYYGVTSRIPGLAWVGQAYYGIFDSVKNGLLFGLVFVAMGAMICDSQKLQQIPRRKTLLGIVLCFGVLCVEAVGYTLLGNVKGVDTVASIIPLTICTFLFALSFDIIPSKACLMLRKYSMLIFLCQRLPLSVIDMFFGKTILAQNSLVYFVSVTAATFLISFLIIKLSEKWSWVKKIY